MTAEWTPLCTLEDIPHLGARVVRRDTGDIALFRNADQVFAVHDKCPHKGGPLSQGIVHGTTVTCPLHSWKIQLESGEAVAPDAGCTRAFEVKVDDGQVLLRA
jgi:nitrite reductase (NADH) small subunit